MAKFLNQLSQATRNFVSSQFQGAGPQLDLVGSNIPFVPIISYRDNFLQSMSQWTNAIPLNTQFIIILDRIPEGVNSEIMRSLEPVDGDQRGFDIDLNKSVLTSFKNMAVVGCIFANGFNIGSENVNVGEATIENNRGFIPGSILEGRAGFAGNLLNVFFRETNTSFTDVILRPWLITAAHRGYVARDLSDPEELEKDVKCNITILQLTRSRQGLSQIPRKTWRFYNCIPTNIDTRSYDHADSEEVRNFNVQFVYDKYEIANNNFLSTDQFIKNLNPFNF